MLEIKFFRWVGNDCHGIEVTCADETSKVLILDLQKQGWKLQSIKVTVDAS